MICLLKTLTELIARNPGQRINYDALAKDLKRSKPTIISYINYLEYALILRLVRNLRPGFLATSRKMRKAYMSNAAFSYIFSPELGKVIENLILQELDAEYYFRENNAEIDFILNRQKQLPMEIKYGKVELKQFLHALDR